MKVDLSLLADKPAQKKTDRVLLFLCTTAVLLFLLCMGLLFYPTVSEWWNKQHTSSIVSDYASVVDDMDEELRNKMLAEAEEYNKKLWENPLRFIPEKMDHELYNSVLDVSGTGVMGYVEIPSIKVKLPIYHGTEDAVLQIAAGHMEGSSFPVGGPGTHAIISGHTGLPSASLFTDLTQLKVGDMFTVNVLGRELLYSVDAINVVLPDDFNYFVLEEDKDYVTLVTCTPYGVNTHRLLVRGSRVSINNIDKENEQ